MKRFPSFHDRYPPELKRWVNSRPWREFTHIQQEALAALPIDPALPLPDAILEAETSSGKTEAVFLPLLARLAATRERGRGFSILYVSPLRALINDQEQRLGELAGLVGLDVHAWHSDVEDKKKERARRLRTGILLTTPESIEGFFIRAGRENAEIDDIARTTAIVIDELHAFFDTARGRHLQSLLHRLDLRAKQAIPRLGLSATLSGIDDSARAVLRPKSTRPTTILRPEGKKARKVTLGLKVFLAGEKDDAGREEPAKETADLPDRYLEALVADFHDDSRGLVFANSRAAVEVLRERATRAGDRTNGIQFERHHSSVKPKERKAVEKAMRDETGPKQMVVICTNTLELGIDIGQVQRVVQIDPTYTVAALRQRVGRSGRRGDAGADGIVYVGERELTADSHPLDRLHVKTFQAAATAQLSLEGSFEEPNLSDLHLSTLYHQVVSVLREGKPLSTDALHQLLVVHGPWDDRTELGGRAFFARFLETMSEGARPAIERVEADEWKLVQGPNAPKPAYAVFSTPPEYAVYANAREIGHLPMTVAYRIGDTFVLAGGRWRVLNVNDATRRLMVTKAPSAGAPRYGGLPQAPSGLVAHRMKELYEGRTVSNLSMNEMMRDAVADGRKAFRTFGLDRRRFLEFGRDVILFPWCGSRRAQTLVLALRREGVRASIENLTISIESMSVDEVKAQLGVIRRHGLPEADELAREARQLQSDRFDRYLIPYHQRLGFARRFLTVDAFDDLVAALLAGEAGRVELSTPTTANVAPSF